jgi:hypothetical protein
MDNGVVIQGLDVLDVVRFIGKKNKKFQAILLNDIEDVLGADSQEYKLVRKLILDGFNNYTRSVLRVIFGDIEHLIDDDIRNRRSSTSNVQPKA